MKRYVEGENRSQSTLFPESLDDYIADDNPVRVVDVFVGELDLMPQASRIRRQTVEHVFGTLKAWMGSTHFLTKTLPRVSTQMSLHVLAYNLKRAMQIIGIVPLIQAMKA